jgi:hypothetical protein
MILLRRYFKPAALAGAAALLAAGCTHITYKLPDEFLSDGDLLMASMKDAALKAAANPALAAENGPFQLTSLATEEEAENLLYSSFEDWSAPWARRGSKFWRRRIRTRAWARLSTV